MIPSLKHTLISSIIIVSLLELATAGWLSSDDPIESNTENDSPGLPRKCRDQPYETHLFSEDPLVIYIDNFISAEEANQLNGMR